MGIRTLFLFIFLFLTQPLLHGQVHERKKLTALRIDQALKIDGKLDEAVYARADTARDFMQLNPYNGQPSYQPTEVYIFYDDNALYIGALLYDNPDSIRSYITTRDNIGMSDYFDVFLDPNNEGLTGYEFLVTPANSQTDLKAVKRDGYDNEDSSWDAVWQSATRIHEKGWNVEIRIPYSALRFPVKEEPVWGLNFFRRLRRYNSNNCWNFVDVEVAGFIQQSGELHGLKDIKSPVRLSVTPYVAGYVEQQSGHDPVPYFKGGMDIKYGISESHTLDMMLIPDFGQIQSDDQQLNLSPYEIYYDEKRQFFVEGVELFERAGIFYSRRIGGKPKFSDLSGKLNENEVASYNPTETQLINATKISGRDKKGWGIGFLNAMTLAGEALVYDTLTGETRKIVTQEFTNYNVTVVEKALTNNSYLSLINTNLSLIGNPYMANVTGTEFQLKNKQQTYQLSGSGALSYKSTAEQKTGYHYRMEVRKVKGKFRFSAKHETSSDTYDPNDMGYLQRNNDMDNQLNLTYNINEPFWILKSWYAEAELENTRLFNPGKHISNEAWIWSSARFKNEMWVGGFVGYNFSINDYFETRVNNRFYKIPQHWMGEFNFETDANKKLSFSCNYGGNRAANDPEMYGYWSYANLWWKASPRFWMIYNISTNQERNYRGYVRHEDEQRVWFGNYNRHTLVNTFSTGYNFNTKMAVDFRARHYWSWAEYNQLFFLNADGSLTPEPGNPSEANVNYNAFNIDMTFKWEFAPGSELSLAWKNSLYSENDKIGQAFFPNLNEMFQVAQTNSLSLKVLYYIDYNTIRTPAGS
ncbi:MAG TPA: DUF5916 domain-containing protein [Prolixibacteraceae bacterium]|nr:DUF5916 domain-containing protein [Prolixibacteraceae bacterium]